MNRTQEAERREAESLEESRRAFYRTPPGRARAAFQREDELFQYTLEVQGLDPNPVLNAVCREGWELITASFVTARQDPYDENPSGSNGAGPTRTIGYYLFRRCEANRGQPADPF